MARQPTPPPGRAVRGTGQRASPRLALHPLPGSVSAIRCGPPRLAEHPEVGTSHDDRLATRKRTTLPSGAMVRNWFDRRLAIAVAPAPFAASHDRREPHCLTLSRQHRAAPLCAARARRRHLRQNRRRRRPCPRRPPHRYLNRVLIDAGYLELDPPVPWWDGRTLRFGFPPR